MCDSKHNPEYPFRQAFRDDDLSQALADSGHQDWSNAYRACGHTVRYLYCEKCDHKVDVPHNCKLMGCPRCLKKRAARLEKRYMKPVSQLKEPKMWTLTLKNTKQLKHGVERIRESFTKLRRRKPFNRILRGGIYAIEANPKPDGYWNVHIHCICDASFIPHEKVKQAWAEITKDSMVVDLKRVDSPKKSFRYILRYLSKGPTDAKNPWPVEAIVKFMSTLQDKRLIQAFGALLGEAIKAKACLCPNCNLALWRVVCALTGDVIWSPWDFYRTQAMKQGP